MRLTSSNGVKAAILLAFSICPVEAAGQRPETFAVRAARVIDGTGAPPLQPGIVLIEGNRILAVGDRSVIPASVSVIDLGEVTILPGLIIFEAGLLTATKALRGH